MGYSIPRTVISWRSAGLPPVSWRTGAYLGLDISKDLTNVINDIELTDFEEILLYAKVTMAYTGGATDPTLALVVQRKIAYDLADSNDDAWEDFARFDDASASSERILRLGAVVGAVNTEEHTIASQTPVRDGLSAGEAKFGHPGSFLRVREYLSGGDRTGGTLSYTLRMLGITVG